MAQNNKQLTTPVLFIIFRRPDTTQMVFNEIRKVKPKVLFVRADGPRKDRNGEAKLCKKTRDIVGNIDWECEVHYNFSETNLGCKVAVSSGIDWFFENVEEGIILEDDCLPCQSFFWFCQELLEKYRDDERIMQISGSNYLFGKTIGNASYYFSRLNDVWGWATWKRAWRFYDINMKSFPVFKQQKQIDNYFDNKRISRWAMSYFEEDFKMANSSCGIWSSQWSYAMCAQNGLTIAPNVNLVSNIGINEEATHSKRSFRLYADVKSYEIEQIIHPEFILPNREADEIRFRVIYKTDPRLRPMTKLKKDLRVLLKKFLLLLDPEKKTIFRALKKVATNYRQ